MNVWGKHSQTQADNVTRMLMRNSFKCFLLYKEGPTKVLFNILLSNLNQKLDQCVESFETFEHSCLHWIKEISSRLVMLPLLLKGKFGGCKH